ncbi:MAG: hypothetical protein PHX30_06180 [Candidatus Pacebacteria bacterium]|nr:hypothetical protein [Candidatus Paceibacterota bacterium]
MKDFKEEYLRILCEERSSTLEATRNRLRRERMELINAIPEDQNKKEKLLGVLKYAIKPDVLIVISEKMSFSNLEEFEEAYRELLAKKTCSGKERGGIEETKIAIVKKAINSGIPKEKIKGFVMKNEKIKETIEEIKQL